jgi:hypothetical protein
MGPLTSRLVLPVHRQVVPWIAPACLVLMAVLVFFPWLASPLALEPFVFWQSGFGAAFGLSHPGLSHLSAAPWIILFLLALLAGVVTIVAGAVRDYVLRRLSVTVPPGLEAVLAARAYILGAASMLALLFLLAQMLVGFPAESYDFAAGSVPEWLEQQRETYGLLMRSLVRRTLWARLTVTLSVVSVLAALTQLWLERRGERPPPRLVVEW